MMRSAQPLLRTLARFALQGSEEGAAQQLLSASCLHTAGVCSSLSSSTSSAQDKRAGPLGLPSLTPVQGHPLLHPQVRFAGDYKPEVPGNTADNWAAMRLSYVREKPNSLGGAYALNVVVFAFAYLLADSYYFPPRTLYLSALVFLLLYVRRTGFVPSFPGAK